LPVSAWRSARLPLAQGGRGARPGSNPRGQEHWAAPRRDVRPPLVTARTSRRLTMWTPTPMRWTTLVVLDTDLTAVTARLGRLGVPQLFDVRALGSWADRLSWEQAEALARAYDALWRRLTSLFEALGLPVGRRPEPGE